jgi:WD40 repeat protein
MNRLLHLVLIPFLLHACSGRMSPSAKHVYNDTVYQQFWTADWSADGKHIAIGGVDSMLRIYSAHNMRLLHSYPLNSWIHSAKWHPNHSRLAIATLDGVTILNLRDGSVKKLKLKTGTRAIGWNRDGQLLAIGDLNGMVHIADESGELINSVNNKYGPEQVGTAFTSLDWHPERNIFIATNFEIGKFDSSGRRLSSMEHKNNALMLAVDWHPSGKFFVIGDYGHNWSGENVPSLLHFWSEDEKYLKGIPGSKGEIRNIAFNKDGSLLATASDVLRIWKSSGELIYEGKYDSSNYLWGISWNPRSNRIVTSSRHKTVALWNDKAKLLKRIQVHRY